MPAPINLSVVVIPSNSDLIKKIEGFRRAPLLTLVLRNGTPIAEDLEAPLYEQLLNIGRVERFDLFLYSRGGMSEISWKIISLLREFCDSYAVLIPFQAQGAATLIALGADEIVMGPISELSPLDPRVIHPLHPKDISGCPLSLSPQDLKHLLELLKREGRGLSAPEAQANIFTALFQYINPLSLGALEESYLLSRQMARKALETHLDPLKDREKIERIVEALCGGYKSPRYPIGRKEAKEELGLNVLYCPGDLWNTIWELYQYYQRQFSLIHQNLPNVNIRDIGYIDSLSRRMACRQAFEIKMREWKEEEQVLVTQWMPIL